MEQMSLVQAVEAEIDRRISVIEVARNNYPWYAFRRRERADVSLANYRMHQLQLSIDNIMPMFSSTVFDPSNCEDVALRNLLASPSTFDS